MAKSDEHFDEYTSLQQAKHAMVERYLHVWFAKLGMSKLMGRLNYVDTHAGPGRFRTGEPGSPIVAVKSLLDHKYRGGLLMGNEFQFYFFERNEEFANRLRTEVSLLGDLPGGINVDVIEGSSFELLEQILGLGGRQAVRPTFAFVDPFSWNISGELLKRLFNSGKVEIFLNLIWRELDLAISHAFNEPNSQWPNRMDYVFGNRRWRAALQSTKDSSQRADVVVDLLKDYLGARWASSFRMVGASNTHKYSMVHFATHPAARIAMREVMWRQCPSGDFEVRQREHGGQLRLESDPDLTIVRRAILTLFQAQRRIGYADLRGGDWGLDQDWLPMHTTKVVRDLIAERKIKILGGGRLSERKRSILQLVE